MDAEKTAMEEAQRMTSWKQMKSEKVCHKNQRREKLWEEEC